MMASRPSRRWAPRGNLRAPLPLTSASWVVVLVAGALLTLSAAAVSGVVTGPHARTISSDLGLPPLGAPPSSLPSQTGRANQAAPSSSPASALGVIVATVPVGTQPLDGAFDPADDEVYVTNILSQNVSVINGTVLAGSVPVGSGPNMDLYDPSSGYVYVANQFTDNVSLLEGTTDVGQIREATDSAPYDEVYDPSNNYIYIEGGANGAGWVAAVEGTDQLAEFTTGSTPEFAAVAPSTGYVYAPDYGASNVTVIRGLGLYSTISVGQAPTGAVYDAADGLVYVTNSYTDNVSIVSGTSVVSTVNVGTDSFAPCYDPANGNVYVPNYVSNNVSVIHGTSLVGTVAVGSYPDNVTYDPDNGLIYVANSFSDNVSVINGSALAGTIALGDSGKYGAGPTSITFDSHDGELYVADSLASNVTVIGPASARPYPVTFVETGLGPGTRWSVNLNGTFLSSESNSISFLEPGGSYDFEVSPVVGYSRSPASGILSVSSTSVVENVTFTLPSYAVTFSETGLPIGTTWWVNLTGGASYESVGAEFTFFGSNGSYVYVTSVADKTFEATESSGRYTIQGTGLNESVTFQQVTFAVTFVQAGLPTETDWSVNVSGAVTLATTGSYLLLTLPNGTYLFRASTANSEYAPDAYGGSFDVDGALAEVTVDFHLVNYSVSFVSTGLIPGTLWWVNLSSEQSFESNASYLGWDEPNGTYTFLASTAGRLYTVLAGSVVVDGAPVSVDLTFRHLYLISFNESGLPTNTNWSVSLQSTTNESSHTSIDFTETNGSYSYTVANVTGYHTVTPGSAFVEVSGADVEVSVMFVKDSQASSSASPPGWEYALGIAGGIGGLAVILVILTRRRQGGRPVAQSHGPTPPGGPS
jgi:DNA-binding beta-propeller fold protein YncE